MTTTAQKKKVLSAREYKEELKLDEEESDINETIDEARANWDSLSLTTVDMIHHSSPSEDACRDDGPICILMEKMGGTYSQEDHGEQLREIAVRENNGILTQDMFVDWFVRWVYFEDEDDMSHDEDPESESSPTTTPLKASAASGSSNSSGGGMGFNWIIKPGGGQTVEGKEWKCECFTINKWDVHKCTVCQGPAPHAPKNAEPQKPASFGAASTSTFGSAPASGAFTFGQTPITFGNSAAPASSTPSSGFSFNPAPPVSFNSSTTSSPAPLSFSFPAAASKATPSDAGKAPAASTLNPPSSGFTLGSGSAPASSGFSFTPTPPVSFNSSTTSNPATSSFSFTATAPKASTTPAVSTTPSLSSGSASAPASSTPSSGFSFNPAPPVSFNSSTTSSPAPLSFSFPAAASKATPSDAGKAPAASTLNPPSSGFTLGSAASSAAPAASPTNVKTTVAPFVLPSNPLSATLSNPITPTQSFSFGTSASASASASSSTSTGTPSKATENSTSSSSSSSAGDAQSIQMKVKKGIRGNSPLVFRKPEAGADIVGCLHADSVSIKKDPIITSNGRKFFEIVGGELNGGFVHCSTIPNAPTLV